tara:strand:- start:24 stop:269 length:246 start_codon:yes stop_codon:yes gene_type:complete
MAKFKKEYSNPQDAAKDLLTIGGAAIVNKTTSGIQNKTGEWIEATPGVSQVFKKAKDLKDKGWSASIDPKGKFTIGFKKEW